jgi:glycosyltransferase involved in cell wall biosynthesis
MAEILTQSSGFLTQPGDVSGLVATLQLALSMSGEERSRMKNAARQRVRDRFDNSIIIPKLLTIYNEMRS